METYGRFLFEFLHQFFSGFGEMLDGIWKGIVNLFNFPQYYYIIKNYANDFNRMVINWNCNNMFSNSNWKHYWINSFLSKKTYEVEKKNN